MSNNTANRLHVVDALRGFAIVAIMLLHNLEHFDFYYLPENFPAWLVSLDAFVWKALFFLFASKSYAMFALLFGLTFYIQSNNQKTRGRAFGARFAWRLILLFIFGLVNSAFYQGDILTIYAVLGFFLIPLGKLSSRQLLWIAIFLMLQPLEWFTLFNALNSPATDLPDPASWAYFGNMQNYIPNASIFEVMYQNLTNGKTAVILWNAENGRLFLILSLFLFGVLAGRKKMFIWNENTKIFWKKALLISTGIFCVLFSIQLFITDGFENEAVRRPLNIILSSWSNTAFMIVLLSSFVILFQKIKFQKRLNYFIKFGKMSLSNYIIQSIIGSALYYGYGFGLYKYTGATFSAIIAIVLVVLIGYFCSWWFKKNKRGPFETIWHKLTWIKVD